MKNNESILRTHVFANVANEKVMITVEDLLNFYEQKQASRKRVSGHILVHTVMDVYDDPNESGSYITEYGHVFYLEKGKYHRIGGPALKQVNGSEYWYEHGVKTRSDGPAVTRFQDGAGVLEQYWFNGKEYKQVFTSETWKEFVKTCG